MAKKTKETPVEETVEETVEAVVEETPVNEWEVKDDPRGSNGKWLFLTGEFVVDDTDPEADRVALDNNYVTITPISIDMTDNKLLAEMKQWEL